MGRWKPLDSVTFTQGKCVFTASSRLCLGWECWKVHLSWPAAGCSLILTVQTWAWHGSSHLSQRKQRSVSPKMSTWHYSVSPCIRYMSMLLQFLLGCIIFGIYSILLGWLFVLKGGHFAWGAKSKILAQHADGCRIWGSGRNQSSHTHLVRLCFTQSS